MRRILTALALLMGAAYALPTMAQEYSGVTGLFHVPSAEMAPAGTARIGAYFLNKEFLPDNLKFEDEKYNTTNHFLGITPFPWIEISYICTLEKAHKYNDDSYGTGYYQKDRHFTVKIRPLKEGKWWPAIAIGVQDPGRTIDDPDAMSAYFSNYYVAATKHLEWGGEFGVTLAYRYYRAAYNDKWKGVAGGVSFRPKFCRDLRALVEYTGNEVNVAVDYLLLKHLYMQAGLTDGKYFTGGVCLRIYLL